MIAIYQRSKYPTTASIWKWNASRTTNSRRCTTLPAAVHQLRIPWVKARAVILTQRGRRSPPPTKSSHSSHQKRKTRSDKLLIPEDETTYNRGTQPTQLCEQCSRIPFSDILDLDVATLQENLRDGVLVKDLGFSLENISESSCALCQLFFHARIRTDSIIKPIEYQLRAYSIFNRLNDMNLDRCPEGLKAKDLPCLAVLPSQRNSSIPHTSIKFIFLHSDKYGHKRVFVPRAIPSFVDFSKVEAVLKYCQSKHSNLCGKYPTQVRGLKLINCEKDASTPSEVKKLLVLASSSSSYVALSYVWGVSNVKDSDPLPKVISDAMIVTKKLGFQFLWVDQYCISQTDHREREHQMDCMDIIYRRAELTIVAAAGQDASFGLPGVGDTPRVVQPAVTVGNIQITSSMHIPRHTIRSSTWATRAWTYQEGLLSRRCLVFTEYETYFECKSMYLRESWTADLDQLHSHGRYRRCFETGYFSGTSRSTIIRSPFLNLQRYYNLACEYSTKTFSHQYGLDDSLRAFKGIMNDLNKRKVPIYQLWGVPLVISENAPAEALKSFVASLLWRHKFSPLSGPQKSPGRRPKFSSWSWSGWSGEIIFPINWTSTYTPFTSMMGDILLEQDEDTIEDLNFLVNDPDLEDREFCNPRALRFNALVLLLPEDSIFRIDIADTTFNSPTCIFAGFKATIYLSSGPQTRNGFKNLFSNARLGLVLAAVVPETSSKRHPHICFIIIETHETSSCRIGTVVLKADFKLFKQNFTFERREIRLV